MKYSYKSSKGMFWGIALILTAVLLIVDSLGNSLGFIDLPLFKMAAGILLLAWAISEVAKRKPSHIFFPLAFIFILFRSNIARWLGAGDTKLIPVWTVLLCALLLQIGTSLVFRRKKKANSNLGVNVSHSQGKFENHLSSGVCYIDASDLGYHRIENKLGELNVFIENAEIYTGNGTIEIENKLGNMNIYIPSAWRVENQVECTLGEVQNLTSNNNLGPVVVIRGVCKLANVRIVNA